MRRKSVPLAWAGVTLIGVIVLVLVVTWQLFPRLFAAQRLVDDLSPAFTVERVTGDRAGIEIVSAATDAGEEMMHRDGAAGEVSKLIALIAERTGRSEADAKALLSKDFPAIDGFLTSLPITEVSAELPKLVHYLGTVLQMTPDQVERMLQTDYPAIHQVIVNLPTLTGGWDAIPGTENLTRFDGTPVRTMPQLRTYLSQEVVAPVERQQANFRPLGTRGGVGFLAPLLLALGAVVVIFGMFMTAKTWPGVPRNRLRHAWIAVPVVGAVVVALVLALNLFPRLIGGQQLLNDTRPVFAQARVHGDRAGIEFIDVFVKALGPAVLPDGGVTAEYPKLLDRIAQHVGVPVQDVRDLLHLDFPHTAKLLDGVPFSAAAADATRLVTFLAAASDVTTDQLLATLRGELPHTYQLITNLKIVTDGWAEVPGSQGLTRFDGSSARSVPLIRDYFRGDVIPALERQQRNYVVVDTNWPTLTVFAPLLTAVGILVIIYGLVLGRLTRRQRRLPCETQRPQRVSPDSPVSIDASS